MTVQAPSASTPPSPSSPLHTTPPNYGTLPPPIPSPPPPSAPPVSRSRRRLQLLRTLLSTPSPSTRFCEDAPPPPSPSHAPPNTTLFTFSASTFTSRVIGNTETLRAAWATRGHDAVWLALDPSDAASPAMSAFLTESAGVPARAVSSATRESGRAKVEMYAGCVVLWAHVATVEDGAVVLRGATVAVVGEARAVVTVGGDARWRAAVADVLRADVGGMRTRGGGVYLMMGMVEAMLERYFMTLEAVGDVLDEVEWGVLHAGEGVEGRGGLDGRETLRVVTRTKRELGRIRRRVWPLREVLTRLAVAEEGLVEHAARACVREGLDRVMQVLDVVECYRDVGHSLLDLHLAAQNNRMQEVMQTLAVVTTIFVPLTFLAGIEGMNFKNQPELYGQWSYFAFWGVVFVVMAAQVAFFRMKGWI